MNPSVYPVPALAFAAQAGLANPQVTQEIPSFYGHVVLLRAEQGEFVVKFSRQAGRLASEVTALNRLRPHSVLPMPEVLEHREIWSEHGKLDTLLMPRLLGVPAWELPNPLPNPAQTAQRIVEQMLAWHAVSDARGFEHANGEFTSAFLPAFESWTRPLLDGLNTTASPFSAELRSAFAKLWAERERLLAPITGPSSLCHDDPHACNFLYDASSGLPVAAIDPCDVAFRHREQDIFHLADAFPDWRLLETYLEHQPLADGFAARRWFFSLWDDVKHSQNVAWYDAAWFANKFAQLAQVDADFQHVADAVLAAHGDALSNVG
ncbi:phosphotransferase [Deefgea sp. CFH1-16]|uniref:phosphotransferase n=1 Tax=Deefgea sp. CFH1-16 TaxID=2675457 RepID=UPI0015F3E26E|nr:phosphotransferase [Deefgea sp. CFH1-16]MBM5574796.1 phosphotransferase [Deefgea sp. CFH1-16]